MLMKIPRPVNLIKWRSSYSDRGDVLSVEFDIKKDGILRIRIVPENGTGGREGGRGKEGTPPSRLGGNNTGTGIGKDCRLAWTGSLVSQLGVRDLGSVARMKSMGSSQNLAFGGRVTRISGA